MNRKILALFLAFALVLSFSACSKKSTDDAVSTEKATAENAASETAKYLLGLGDLDEAGTFEAEFISTGEDGTESTVTMTYAVSGDKTYTKMVDTSGEIIYLLDSSTKQGYYMMPSEKTCYQQTLTDDQLSGDPGILSSFDFILEDNLAPQDSGEMDVNGTTYTYEEFLQEADASESTDDTTTESAATIERFCYNSDGTLEYVVGMQDGEMGSYTHITKLSSDVDESLFEIPSDYTVINMDDYADSTESAE